MSARSYLEVRLLRARLQRAGRPVLRDVSWTIRPGEHWVLAGANGAGKTQLLKVVAGAVWPSPAAHAVVRYRLGREQASTPYAIKDEIAYLGAERQDKYQRYGWNMAARRILATGLYRTDIPLDVIRAVDARRIGATLGALGIAHLAARPFLSLSYGERRLILLARALLSRPRLLLLDEALNGLDTRNRRRMLAWLAHRRRALPWVLATHRIEDVPAGATHALVLDRGRVVYGGHLGDAPLTRWLAQPAPCARGMAHGISGAASEVESTARPASGAARAGGARGARGARGVLVRLRRARVYLAGRCVLGPLSLTVRAGEWWIVHGHNGAGKTTLLRTLYGDHGVAFGGIIERAGVAAGVPLESFKRGVGLIAPHLQADHPAHLRVCEVVQSGRHASIGLNAAPSAADRHAARRALARFGLRRLGARAFGELSYGQARRVLFARAFVLEPKLLLLDEPFAGIDARTRAALIAQVRTLAASGAAVVMATHRPEEWSGDATQELELSHGRARYCGPLRRAAAGGPCSAGAGS